jgi:hypothetical protein
MFLPPARPPPHYGRDDADASPLYGRQSRTRRDRDPHSLTQAARFRKMALAHRGPPPCRLPQCLCPQTGPWPRTHHHTGPPPMHPLCFLFLAQPFPMPDASHLRPNLFRGSAYLFAGITLVDRCESLLYAQGPRHHTRLFVFRFTLYHHQLLLLIPILGFSFVPPLFGTFSICACIFIALSNFFRTFF